MGCPTAAEPKDVDGVELLRPSIVWGVIPTTYNALTMDEHVSRAERDLAGIAFHATVFPRSS